MAQSVSEYLRTRGVIDSQSGSGSGPASAGDPELDEILKRRGSTRLASLAGAIHGQESGGGKVDTSRPNNAGARGPMQVLEPTFKQMQAEGRIPSHYRWDNPAHSKEAGVAYLEMLDERTGGDARKTAQGYYGGPGAIGREGRRDPRNPKAPTVGQYADEVIARMGVAPPAAGKASAPAAAPKGRMSPWQYLEQQRNPVETELKPEESPQQTHDEPGKAPDDTLPSSPSMTWDQVANHETYLKADEATREMIRERYWTDEIAPRIPASQQAAARRRFDEDTRPGVGAQVADAGKALLGGAIEGVGMTVRGIGETMREGGQAIASGINSIAGTELTAVNPLTAAADWIDEKGAAVADSRTLASQIAQQQSTPEGTLLDPSTWSAGTDPSLAGYVQQGMSVLGQFAPVIAGLYLTRGRSMGVQMGAGAAMGGAQGGGAAAQQARETIQGMNDQQLEQESSFYRQLRERGIGAQQARAMTAEEAAKWAFRITVPISALGGMATGAILSPAARLGAGVAGGSVIGNAAVKGGLSSLEEGLQETAEGVATEQGINVGAGTERDVMEGSVANFALGALGGAVPGAVSGGLDAKAEQARRAAEAVRAGQPIPPPPPAGPAAAGGSPPPRPAPRQRGRTAAPPAGEPIPASEVLGTPQPEITVTDAAAATPAAPTPAPETLQPAAPVQSAAPENLQPPDADLQPESAASAEPEVEADDEMAGETDFGQAAADAAQAQDGPMSEADASAMFDELAGEIDAKANEAATSPTNDLPEPTPAQKEAGNFKKGHVRVQGLDISIENPAGSERKGTGKDGKPWSVTMPGHYGYIKGTIGKDKDHIDVTLGPDPENARLPIFVMNQTDPDTGKFDEHKVFMGYPDSVAAQQAYRDSFRGKFGQKMLNNLHSLAQFTPSTFKDWLTEGDKQRPAKGLTAGQVKAAFEEQARLEQEAADAQMLEADLAEADGEPETTPAAAAPAEGDLSQLMIEASAFDEDAAIEAFGNGDEAALKAIIAKGKAGSSAAAEPETAQRTLQEVKDSIAQRGAKFVRDGWQKDAGPEHWASSLERFVWGKVTNGLASDEPLWKGQDRAAHTLEIIEAVKAKLGHGPKKSQEAEATEKPETELDADSEVAEKFKDLMAAGDRSGHGYSSLALDLELHFWMKKRVKHPHGTFSNLRKAIGRRQADTFEAALRKAFGSITAKSREAFWNKLRAHLAKEIEAAYEALKIAEPDIYKDRLPDSVKEGRAAIAALETDVNPLLKAVKSISMAWLQAAAGAQGKTGLTNEQRKTEATGERAERGRAAAADETAEGKEAKAKAAAAHKKAVKHARIEGERQAFTAALAMPIVQEQAEATNFRELVEPHINKWLDEQIEAAKADPARSEALTAFKKDLAEKATEGGEAKQGKPRWKAFYDSLQREAKKAAKQAELDRNRDPEVFKTALYEAAEAARISMDAASGEPQAFKDGFNHALAGKTKSTVAGENLAIRQKGYEAGKAWIGTDEGRAWYTGKSKQKKLESTVEGKDVLRRPMDILKEAMANAKRSDLEDTWRAIRSTVDRATLFRPKLADDATPGARRFLEDEIRPSLNTFKAIVGSQGWFANSYYGEDQTFEYRLSKTDSTEANVEAMKSLAGDYVGYVEDVIEVLNGAKTIAELVDRLNKHLTSGGRKWDYQNADRKFWSKPPIDASSWRVQHAIRDENKVIDNQRTQPLRPPKLDRVERAGLADRRGGKDMTPEAFQSTFGFAGVQFGGWVGSKQDRDHLNYSYDALLDLADLLGRKPTDLALKGSKLRTALYFTIGALGHGKHAAHFSPNHPNEAGKRVAVINVTNTQGDGTVAHEWGHALDYALRPDQDIDDLHPALEVALAAITYRAIDEDAEWEAIVKRFLSGQSHWSGMGRKGKLENARAALTNGYYSRPKNRSDYFNEAERLDKGGGKQYWSKPTELFARALEVYVFDKLAGDNKASTYLVNPWVRDGAAGPPAYRGRPYASGEERKQIAKVLDALFKAIEWKDGAPTLANDALDHLDPVKRWKAARERAIKRFDEIVAQHEEERRIAELAKKAEQRSKAEEARRKEEEAAAARRAEAAAQAERVVNAPSEPMGALTEAEAEAMFDELVAQQAETTKEEPETPPAGAAMVEASEASIDETPAEFREPLADWNALDYSQRHALLEKTVYGSMPRVRHRMAGSKFAELGEGERNEVRKALRAKRADNSKTGEVAAKMIAEAAKLGVSGLDDTLKGLAELFGGNGVLRSFPAFDEEAYKRAVPYFNKALAKFQESGKTLRDLFRFLIQEAGAGIKPYLIRWQQENKLGMQLAPQVTPSVRVANWVKEQLTANRQIDWGTLFDKADEAFGGTQATGTYTPKDAYDALEAGVNMTLREMGVRPDGSVDEARDTIRNLKDLMKLLPTQTKRTAETDEFQQFSTPPSYAYVVNWLANIQNGEQALEPSAGIGGLAIFAENAGAKLVLNELSQRRAGVLRSVFPGARVLSEDASQLHNILPDDIAPTVIVMNPPFSATAGRVEGRRDTMEGAKHIEQALKRLRPGGRLVAIVGEGMAADRPAFKDWWSRIRSQYNVRANVGVDGSGYAKYGTTFDNQILVIDKTGPTQGSPIVGKFSDIAELPAVLQEVRNARRPPTEADRTAQSGAPESGRDATPPAGMEKQGGAASSRPGATGDRAAGGAVSQPDAGGNGGATGRPRTGSAGVGNALPDDGAQRGGHTGGRGPAGRGSAQGDLPGAAGVAREDSVAVTAGDRERATGELTDSIFETYQPARVRVAGAQPHKGALVESASMASVDPPAPTYTPNLPKEVITSGALSLPQIEVVVYAGQQHQKFLPNGERAGFLIGDGTGVGKGREIAGIILDNFRQGRKKAIWVSEKHPLAEDALRDAAGVLLSQPFKEGSEEAKRWKSSPAAAGKMQIHRHVEVKASANIPFTEGVLFTAYSYLRGGFQQPNAAVKLGKDGKPKTPPASRVKQIADWVGADFDGVLVFDEAHAMANAVDQPGKRGGKKASNQALAAVELQRLLPKARVVYVSATAATEVANLAYANRLGLWGEGTPFATVQAFVARIAAAGVSAMELVARDLKALGRYLARSLSFDGIAYSRNVHDLSDLQVEVYDKVAGAWQIVLQNINEALKDTGQENDGRAKGGAMSLFWSAHQRFFNQLITAMQMPSILEQARKDVEAGHSPVLQLVNTNEADQERAVAKRQSKDEDTEEEDDSDAGLEFGPMDGLINYVEKAFPVNQFVEEADADGNVRWVPALDSQGNPVINKDAVAKRDALIADLKAIAQSTAVPGNPLDLIIEEFGADNVAEITGRGRRFVRKVGRDGTVTIEEQKRGKAAAFADAQDFQGDKKRVLVFSMAGGTGFSYHASLDEKTKNRRLRKHYLVQPGWQADKAVQGFGRTHRTNQAQPPEYILCTTNLKAQKRFISSIARRLDQLGALTRGERKATSQLFSAADNLESQYAIDAQIDFWKDLYAGQIDISLDAKPTDPLTDPKFAPLKAAVDAIPGLTFADYETAVTSLSNPDNDVHDRRSASNTLLYAARAAKAGDAEYQALFRALSPLQSPPSSGSAAFEEVCRQMGLDLLDATTQQIADTKIPPIQRFLNRLLSLNVNLQDQVFDAFYQRMEERIEAAIEAGTHDVGLETLRALSARKVIDETVSEDAESGAKTRYVEVELTKEAQLNDWATVQLRGIAATSNLSGFYRDERTGAVFMAIRRGQRVNAKGQVVKKAQRWDVSGAPRMIENLEHIEAGGDNVVREGPHPVIKETNWEGAPPLDGYYRTKLVNDFNRAGERGARKWIAETFSLTNNERHQEMRAAAEAYLAAAMQRSVMEDGEYVVARYTKLSDSADRAEVEAEWTRQHEAAPKTRTESVHMITGAILPLWDRFGEGKTRVGRTQTVDGERLLGRIIPEDDLKKTLDNLGVNPFAKLALPDVFARIKDGESAILSNGWIIRKVRVSNDQRIEVTNPRGSIQSADGRILVQQGAIQERISFNDRYFIPTDDVSVFERIMAGKVVADIVGGKGQAVYSRQGPAPVFYSATLKAIEGAKSPKLSGEQWERWLGNQPGIKAEELDWLGLREWLRGQSDRQVAREQVADYVRAHQIEVRDVTMGAGYEGPRVAAVQRLLDAGYEIEDDVYLPSISLDGMRVNPEDMPDELRADWESIRDNLPEEGVDGRPVATQYHEYQVPGGEDYGELLLTLPANVRGANEGEVAMLNRRLRDKGLEPLTGEQYELLRRGGNEAAAMLEDFDSRLGVYVADIVGPMSGNGEGRIFRTGHWGTPNVLAHVRFNSRTDADGKKTLFIEEIQSDWHQRGRKHGYKPAAIPEPEKITGVDQLPKGWTYTHDGSTVTLRDDKGEFQGARTLSQHWINEESVDEAVRERAVYLYNSLRANQARDPYLDMVPDAPFKTTWPELTLKRMIRWAAENGYDRVAWTPGDVQADRYSLANHVDSITVKRYGDRSFRVEGYKGGSSVIDRGANTVGELEGLIGKDLAKKADELALHDERTFDGLDLKIGGQGMIGFYDKILVDTANRLGKKFGAKVSQAKIITEPTTWNVRTTDDRGNTTLRSFNARWQAEKHANETGGKAVPVKAQGAHSLDITPAMREAAMQGFPLFRDAEVRTYPTTVEDVRSWLGSTPLFDAVKIVPDVAALIQATGDPRHQPDTEGVYRMGDDTVFIVANMVKDREHAQTLYRHEVNGHLAVELYSDVRAAVGDIIAAKDSATIAPLWAEVGRLQPGLHRGIHAREVIALVAERGIESPVLTRLIGRVRAIIRKLGIRLEYTEADIRALIADAARMASRDAAAYRAQRALRARRGRSMASRAGNFASFNGKPFWSGELDLRDGKIGEVHSHERAAAADWHHSLYFSPAAQERMSSGESTFFWIESDGKINVEWRNQYDAATKARLIRQIRSQVEMPGGASVYRRAGNRTASSPDHTGLIDAAFKHLGGKQFGKLITSPIYDRLIRAGGALIPEKVKQGFVADYGLPEPYLDAKIDKQAAVNKVLRKTRNLIEMLAGLDREQSRIAYLWMNEKPDTDLEAQLLAQLPEDSRAVVQRMKDLVDELGREAVSVGLLTEDSYARNRMAYLHRSYKVHMVAKGESQQARHKKNASIRADNYKGRGLRDDVSPDSLGEYELGEIRTRIELRGPRGGLREVKYIRPDETIPEGWTEDGDWEVRWESNKPGVGPVVGMWRDLRPEERQRLGEIEEVRYAFAKTMLNAIQDIETQKFLAWVGSEYAVEPTEDMEIIESSDGFLTLKTYRQDQYVKVPSTGIPKTPGIKKYGALAGKVIPAVMWNDIRNSLAMPESDAARFFDKVMRAWKISKTALSPTVHTNNIMSNFVLADIAEVRGRDIARALRTMSRAGDGDAAAQDIIARYEDSGAESGSFHSMELHQDIIKPLLRELENTEDESLLGELSVLQILELAKAGDLKNAGKAIGRKWGVRHTLAGGRKMIDLYRNEDSVFRLAKFMREVDAGRSDRDAGKAARDAFLNYEINAPVIQTARRTVLPFIAFSYRAIPKMIETAAHKPWKLGKYFAAGYALNALAYSMLGLGDDDEEKERSLLPEEMRGRVLGVFPRLVRLPWNDANSAPVFLDVRRWVPAGDIMDTMGSHGVVPLPNWLSVGGPISFLLEAYANKSSFTGEPIVKDSDTPRQKAAKFADYAFKWAAPNLPLPNPLNFVLPAGRDGDEPRFINLGLIPGIDRDQLQTYSWTGIMRAGTGREDAFGRESGSVGQALASSIGVKARSYPTDVAKRRTIGQAKMTGAEIDENIRRLSKERARGGLTEAEYRERVQYEVEKKKELFRKAAERLGAGAEQ